MTRRIIDKFSRVYKSAIVSFNLHSYYKKHAQIRFIGKAPQNENYCELIVISFNNSDVINYQIKTLKRYFKHPFRYTVFDNSTKEDKSQKIYEVTKNEGVGYVRLPEQRFIPKGLVSYSHGIALNYIFRNYKHLFCNAKYIGILDHDIFCIEDFDISCYLKNQPFYGLVHHRSRNPDRIKYIWPGFAFYKKSIFDNLSADFRPSIRLAGDTGVRLYESIYSKYSKDLDELNMVVEEHRFLDNTNNVANAGYSYFSSGWIHCWNASNYMNLNGMKNKMESVFKIINKQLEE